MKANPMVNIYHIRVNDIICIPVSLPHNYTNNTTYLVEDGDTLGSILQENSINLSDLVEMNQLDTIEMNSGVTLQIPMQGEGES